MINGNKIRFLCPTWMQLFFFLSVFVLLGHRNSFPQFLRHRACDHVWILPKERPIHKLSACYHFSCLLPLLLLLKLFCHVRTLHLFVIFQFVSIIHSLLDFSMFQWICFSWLLRSRFSILLCCCFCNYAEKQRARAALKLARFPVNCFALNLFS